MTDIELARPAFVQRSIQLRDLHLSHGIRSALWAWIGTEGELHLDGQDLNVPMMDDGEYEYFRIIAAEDLPALVALLRGRPHDDVLALLARDYSGRKSFDLEDRLRQAPFPTRLHVL